MTTGPRAAADRFSSKANEVLDLCKGSQGCAVEDCTCMAGDRPGLLPQHTRDTVPIADAATEGGID